MDFDIEVRTPSIKLPRGWLKRRFYQRNKFRVENWDGTSAVVPSNPITIREVTDNVSDTKTAIYNEDYYVEIKMGRSMLHGPHSAQLFVKLPLYNEAIWLGTCQFEGAYFDSKIIGKQLRHAIKAREYWCSPQNAEEEFEIKAETTETLEIKEEDSDHGKKRRKRPAKTLVELDVKMLYPHGRKLPLVPKCPLCKAKKKTFLQLSRHFNVMHPKHWVVYSWPVRP